MIRVLAMGCPISTLETLIMVFTDMNKIWMNQVYRSHIRSWIEFYVYKSISYAQGILKDSLLFFFFFFFTFSRLSMNSPTPPSHSPFHPLHLFPIKKTHLKPWRDLPLWISWVAVPLLLPNKIFLIMLSLPQFINLSKSTFSSVQSLSHVQNFVTP